MSKNDGFAEVGKTAVLQNIQGTMHFLLRYAPFNQMELSHLAQMVEQCRLRFYAAGDPIVGPSDGKIEDVYIVKQGLVLGQRPTLSGDGMETTQEIAPGECFPVAAMVSERATRSHYIAAEDTFCLQLGRAAFVHTYNQSEAFRDFALRGVSSLVGQVQQQVQMQAAESLGARYSLETRLNILAAPEPVTCRSGISLRDAVKLMHEKHVGSLIMIDDRHYPIGIFTLRDLRRVIADGSGDLQQPLDELMTPDPIHLPPTATAFEAALTMTRRRIAHICVVEMGRLVGVLSERDLFSLQRVDLVHLARTISAAPHIDTLVELREEIAHLIDNMLAHGANPEQLTHIITLLNDHTVARVIELMIEAHGDPGVPFTWLVFGSEGRLLPLARAINAALDRCGFALCNGNIMAGNPELCLSRQEWLRRFSGMIQSPTRDNLMHSSIFFDLRPVWGPSEGCRQLQEALLGMIEGNSLFQHMMAANALRHPPPIGRFRDFIVASRGDDKDTLDIKVEGLMPFVEGVRILALAHGIGECNTLERLRQLGARGVLKAQDAAAYEEAYHFIQMTRMQLHQRQERAGQPLSNRLDPDTLNQLDRRILRESFRQAQRLQSSLSVRYQL
ncbi:CBS domain-containing protein [Pseudomonas sp. OF001]|uniref:putative nucleotidyltransferase substrate binding domain-containing protein n=1 Tax=Pseudomonas sp. OF001 TaxID=2772300 RepID=UPI00191A0A03|nr:putative nucleotidyltransferase substrate binding domain-containing protein [Pseudomonas sp. OF001]CAD5377644.1 CBS domain-containing protein [Pseudomonas sp. OF001]